MVLFHAENCKIDIRIGERERGREGGRGEAVGRERRGEGGRGRERGGGERHKVIGGNGNKRKGEEK